MYFFSYQISPQVLTSLTRKHHQNIPFVRIFAEAKRRTIHLYLFKHKHLPFFAKNSHGCKVSGGRAGLSSFPADLAPLALRRQLSLGLPMFHQQKSNKSSAYIITPTNYPLGGSGSATEACSTHIGIPLSAISLFNSTTGNAYDKFI